MISARSLRLALAALASASLIPSLVYAQGASVNRDITGWQKLDFGMSIEQVRAAYANAELMNGFCSDDRDQFVRADEACEQVWIREVQAAGLTWFVSMKFSRSRELFEVGLTLEDRSLANYDTFGSVLASLNKSYGGKAKAVQLASQSEWEVACKEARARRDSGEPFRPIDMLQTEQERIAVIQRDSGYLRLTFNVRTWCAGAPAESTKHLGGPQLELTYTRRTVTTTDGL